VGRLLEGQVVRPRNEHGIPSIGGDLDRPAVVVHLLDQGEEVFPGLALRRDWLTLRTPTPDSNRSRWPLDPRWQAVRSASLAHGATELRFIRERKRATVLRNLMPALVGYLVAFADVMGTTDIDDTFGELLDAVNDEIVRRMTFAERVRRRRAVRGFR